MKNLAKFIHWLTLATAMSMTAIIFAAPVTFPPENSIDTLVGGGNGDGGPALNAILDPRGMVSDGPAGTEVLYIADALGHRLRQVSGNLITTIAGTGVGGFSGDNGPATSAQLNVPMDVALGPDGSLYVADRDNHRIRKITPQGTITTVAGNGVQTFSGDGESATAASLNQPHGIVVGATGILYIADFGNNRIRKVANGIITTVAGTGQWGYNGDGGLATSSRLANPTDVAIGPDGLLYLCDFLNDRIRRLNANGTITTVAGTGVEGFSGDDGLAISAQLKTPLRIAFEPVGHLLIADTGNQRVRRVHGTTQIITTVAGTGTTGGTGDGGPATQATLDPVSGLAISSSSGIIYIASTAGQRSSPRNRIRGIKVINGIGIIQTGVGGDNGDGGLAGSALINPRGSAVWQNQLYLTDSSADPANSAHRLRRVDLSTGLITTLAGTGIGGYSGDNGPATSAQLQNPKDVAVDPTDGTLYIADTSNNCIRKIAPNGTITTVAGTGAFGFSGDGGPATQATLAMPFGVAVDAQRNLYIADFSNYRIRKVTNGTITTVAGTGAFGFSGDGGPASGAKFNGPSDVAVGADGSLYVADLLNNRIRKVDPQGTITTYAGGSQGGSVGDGQVATNAFLNRPLQLALDPQSHLYIADSSNAKIRRVDAQTQIITTVAGTGPNTPDTGDGGPAALASLSVLGGVTTDDQDHVFLSLPESGRVRVVTVPAQSAPPVNHPPSANAGLDTNVSLPATVSLNGDADDDGLPNPPGILTVTWSQVSGAGTVTFMNNHAVDTTASFSAPDTYILRLTVSDTLLSNEDDVIVIVTSALPVDTTPPTVSITAPASGTTYTSAQTITLTASASDASEINRVEFYDGTILKGTDTTSPYTYAWSFLSSDNGTHTWTAKAYDLASTSNSAISTAVALTVNISAPPTLPSITQSLYTFDNVAGQNVPDSSGVAPGLFQGSLTNYLVTDPVRSGQVLQFNGQDQYVDIAADVSETAYTMALWMQTSCWQCGIAQVADGSLGANGHDRHLFVFAGNVCSRVWNNEGICTTGGTYPTGGVADGAWHHIALVFGGTEGGQKIYVDGQVRASGLKAASAFDTQTAVHLGFSMDRGFFTGRLDDVRIYNRALSIAEIQSLAVNPAPSDTTPPTITTVSSSGVTSTGATMSWTTNEASDSEVQYGLTTTYGSTSSVRDTNPRVTIHSVALSGLGANTLYHFRVRSRDAAGNLATSNDFTFTTSAASDTTAPTISGVAVSNLSATGATVSWTTNEASDAQVDYGLSSGYGSSSPVSDTNPRLTSHSVALSNLSVDTLYHYRVKSRDAAGNLRVGSDGTFRTSVAPSTFNYTLSASGALTIIQGQQGTTTISRTLVTGSSQPVTLSASGLPTGANAIFSSNPCDPNCSSALTITTSVTTPPGIYSVTVTGTPLSKTTTVSLTITPAAPATSWHFVDIRNSTVSTKNSSWSTLGTIPSTASTIAIAIWSSLDNNTISGNPLSPPANYGVNLQSGSCQITQSPWSPGSAQQDCVLIQNPASLSSAWYLATVSSMAARCNVQYVPTTRQLLYQDRYTNYDCALAVFWQ